jgi:hypothetical protein
MIKNALTLITAAWLLTGCVAGQYLKMDHTPTERAQASNNNAVQVAVEDNRSYVIDRSKRDYYIGRYRAGFGNTWDVTTFKKVPLKEQIKTDIAEELTNMGFSPSKAGKQLYISILEWNFDGYQNGRFWYEISVEVRDPQGKVLATSKLADEHIIRGTVMSGAKGGFEREMPGHYEEIIDSLIRSNPEILNALKS